MACYILFSFASDFKYIPFLYYKDFNLISSPLSLSAPDFLKTSVVTDFFFGRNVACYIL